MTATYTPNSVTIADVEIIDEFWSPWIERNREITLEHQYEQMEDVGTLNNFRRVANGKSDGFQGMWFQDSDAYKWLEATSYVLATQDKPELKSRVDEVIDLLAEAQKQNGYLNTYFQLVEPDAKWTNLHFMHELYCAGHLIEAAVAHYVATGEETLLNVATDFADHIDEVFGDKIDGVPGHEEIELALLKLYRVTGEQRYLERARYFVELRGREDRLEWELSHLNEIGGWAFDEQSAAWEDSILEEAQNLFTEDGDYDGSYAQAHAPIEEQDSIEGHAVRAMYLYSSVTDIVAETGDTELFNTIQRLWTNMTTKRMYVTGGIGSSHEHEGFTEDYDLPNETAYAETCAAVGSILWNKRLFELTTEAKYADLIERTLYNGFLAGVSVDGTRFFYENPLASSGDHHRKGWFTCACCPPNAARLLASLGQYLYSIVDGELYVNQYVGSDLTTTVDDSDLELSQSSSLPWNGRVTIEIDADGSVPVNLRVPEWTPEMTITVDGNESTSAGTEYITLERDWEDTTVEIDFDLQVEFVRAHPDVESDAGRVAVKRGPLVYCAEGVDNDFSLFQYALDTNGTVETNQRPDLLGGVTTLEVDATVPAHDGWDNKLYRSDTDTTTTRTRMNLVPYYAWDNRDPGRMQVWIRADEH